MTPGPRTPDPIRRSAARAATLVAVPAAVLVAVLSLLTHGGTGPAPAPATDPVSVAAPALAPDAFGVCQAIVADLPDSVAGLARRPVSAGPEQNAAYGDPPVTLACGTDRPTVEPTADLVALSGVCWLPAVRSGATAYTTVDRRVPVTVVVPGAAEGSAQYVVAFSAAIGPNDPTGDTIPTGCNP
jgi:hypothetical protein